MARNSDIKKAERKDIIALLADDDRDASVQR